MSSPIKLYPVTEVDYKNMTVMEARVLPWVAAKGDASLRIEYSLSPNSIVYDVGGYVGDWAHIINKMYGCNIKVFEPVEKYIKGLNKMFKQNGKVTILPYGLGGTNRTMQIGIDNEASSVFKSGNATEKIQIKDVANHVKRDQVVDLIKMNIEGGEYELLERLIETSLIKNVKQLQIQFHDFVPNAKIRRRHIHKLLSKTHHLTYNYPFIWEGWEIND